MLTYGGAHLRVRSLRGAPYHCEYDESHPGPFEWASLSGDYDDPDDYIQLCRSCHRMLDAGAPKRKSVSTNNRPRGERNPRAKLSDNEVKELRRLRKRGLSQPKLSEHFGISQSQVSRIINRKSRT